MNYQTSFSRFLYSKEIYNTNKKFWKENIEKIYGEPLEEWVINEYANGNEILDGNPIYSAKIGSDKAIRIIQDERNKLTPIFASWLGTVSFEEQKIQELVIAIQPYENIYKDSIELVKLFKEKSFKGFQNLLNKKYGEKTDFNRISYLTHCLKRSGLKEDLWNISKNQIENKSVNISLFKKIHALNEDIQLYELQYIDKSISQKYSAVVLQLSVIDSIITCNDQINITKITSSKDYFTQVQQRCVDLTQYKKVYNRKVDNLENKFVEFEKLVEDDHIRPFINI